MGGHVVALRREGKPFLFADACDGEDAGYSPIESFQCHLKGGDLRFPTRGVACAVPEHGIVRLVVLGRESRGSGRVTVGYEDAVVLG